MEVESTIYNADNLGNVSLLVKPYSPVSFIMSHSDSSQSESENMDSPRSYQCYGDERRKMDNKLDWLSALPDRLILHILSSFQMKDVIQTGVSHSPKSNRDVTIFIKSIDDTLILSKPSKLNEFAVEFLYSNQFVDHVNRWMIFLKIKSVEVVDLNLLRRRGLEEVVQL
ncbi:hypothetical protein P3S67_024017 [Capsicum chacoense]